jgi:alpha-glucosidase (family GH31 glycosyl hydrolase)
LHTRLAPEILDLARHAAKTGEPVVRHLEYVFPGRGYERVQDQFLLGDTILVAPVTGHGARSRKVVFPPGRWLSEDGSAVEGPSAREVPAPLERLPWWRRVAGE